MVNCVAAICSELFWNVNASSVLAWIQIAFPILSLAEQSVPKEQPEKERWEEPDASVRSMKTAPP